MHPRHSDAPLRNRSSDSPLPAFRAADAVLALLFLLAALLFIPAMRANSPTTVTVFVDNRKVAQYPLDEDRTFPVEGRQGPVTLSVKDRTVRVAFAPCPQQVCVHAGAISRPGRQIVCAPGHLLIAITSQKQSGVPDAVAR